MTMRHYSKLLIIIYYIIFLNINFFALSNNKSITDLSKDKIVLNTNKYKIFKKKILEKKVFIKKDLYHKQNIKKNNKKIIVNNFNPITSLKLGAKKIGEKYFNLHNKEKKIIFNLQLKIKKKIINIFKKINLKILIKNKRKNNIKNHSFLNENEVLLNKKNNTINKKLIDKKKSKFNNLNIEDLLDNKKLNIEFYNKKGKLSWPVDNGKIINNFGKQNYPGLQSIYIQNSGIDILTKNNSVRSIFKGIVSGIYTINNELKAVIIRHGDYYSVYNNLKEVFVKKGEKIDIKQLLGKIYINLNGEILLNFQIWHNVHKENPSKWIKNFNEF